jgi:hypothetical protein
VGGSVHYAALPPDREGETVRPFGVCTADLNEFAYFSDRGRSFQPDRGRRFDVIADDHRGARATG